MPASTVFIPTTETFGELTIRPVPALSRKVKHAVFAVAFLSAFVVSVGGLLALDRAAYAQHDSDPYVYLRHGA